jgi:outer membrane receptor protein involved in Fe transport
VTDALTIDAGFRQVENEARGYSLGLTVANLGDATTLADNATRAFTAPGARSYKYDQTAWTFGANYTLTDSIGLYARASKAYRGPSEFNILLPIAGGVTAAEQYEAGVKLDTARVSIFATAFLSKFDPFTASLFETNPTTGAVGFINFIGTVESPGIEVDFSVRPTRMFSIDGSYTYNDAQIGDFAPAPGAPATARATNSDGNQPIRQPKVYGNIRPSLKFQIGDWDAIADVRYNFVGDRYVDLLNRTLLPSFQTVGAGFTVSNGVWDAQIVGDNLTNEEGITEGNPRTDQLSGQGTAVVNYGRPIFGRSVKVVLTRKW